MLLGLMSRWTIPRSWACIRPRATAAMIERASRLVEPAPCGQQVAKALAGDEFQDHVRDAVVLVEFQQVDHIGIVGLRHEPGLLAKPPEDIVIADPVGPQDLDGDNRAVGRILGAVDDSLASFAQLVEQAIPAQVSRGRVKQHGFEPVGRRDRFQSVRLRANARPIGALTGHPPISRRVPGCE